jgi:biopolymer transport protein ExbD
MRMIPRVRSHSLLIELTPMIDVVFLLIIFFMAAAEMAQESRADLDLPLEAGESLEAAQEAGLIINITAGGDIVTGTGMPPISLVELGAWIDDAATATGSALALPVMIRADHRSPAGVLNSVVTLLKDRGVGVARIATEVPRN